MTDSPSPGETSRAASAASAADEAHAAAARRDVDAAVVDGDAQKLASALRRMGVPGEDDLTELAAGLLAIRDDADRRRRLDRLEMTAAPQDMEESVALRHLVRDVRAASRELAVAVDEAATPATITDGRYTATLTDVGDGYVSVEVFVDGDPFDDPLHVSAGIAETYARSTLAARRQYDVAEARRRIGDDVATALAWVSPWDNQESELAFVRADPAAWPPARQAAEMLAIAQMQDLAAREAVDEPVDQHGLPGGKAEAAVAHAQAALAAAESPSDADEFMAVERARAAIEAMTGGDPDAAEHARVDVRVRWYEDDLLGLPEFRGVPSPTLGTLRANLDARHANLVAGDHDDMVTRALFSSIGALDQELRRREALPEPTTVANGRYAATLEPLTGHAEGPVKITFTEEGRPFGRPVTVSAARAESSARDAMTRWLWVEARWPSERGVATDLAVAYEGLLEVEEHQASDLKQLRRQFPGSAEHMQQEQFTQLLADVANAEERARGALAGPPSAASGDAAVASVERARAALAALLSGDRAAIRHACADLRNWTAEDMRAVRHIGAARASSAASQEQITAHHGPALAVAGPVAAAAALQPPPGPRRGQRSSTAALNSPAAERSAIAGAAALTPRPPRQSR